jgi:hypothetical protein
LYAAGGWWNAPDTHHDVSHSCPTLQANDLAYLQAIFME